MIYVAEFDHEENRYVAIGQDPLHLSVYEKIGTRRVEKTRMFYPSCLRFMPWVYVHADEPRTMTSEQFERLYEIVGRKHMITIRAEEGTATYVLDPYPHWDGDDAMMDRGAELRALVDTELVAREPDLPDAPDRSQRLHRAFVAALMASGITIVEAVLPDLDPPYDPLRVR